MVQLAIGISRDLVPKTGRRLAITFWPLMCGVSVRIGTSAEGVSQVLKATRLQRVHIASPSTSLAVHVKS